VTTASEARSKPSTEAKAGRRIAAFYFFRLAFKFISRDAAFIN
jgi:hypothetical protein